MNSSNVAAGKPRIVGAIHYAPLGTELPTDATTPLGDEFIDCGFASDSGLVNTAEIDSSNVKAWGGTVVLALLNEKTDEFQIGLIEATNPDVLKAIYGENNVTVDSETGDFSVAATAEEPEEHVWVFDMVLRQKYKRVVLPDAKLSSLGDIEYKDDDIIKYDATFTALPDSENSATHYEYFAAIPESD